MWEAEPPEYRSFSSPCVILRVVISSRFEQRFDAAVRILGKCDELRTDSTIQKSAGVAQALIDSPAVEVSRGVSRADNRGHGQAPASS